MRNKFGREILLLMGPVLLIGGAGLFSSSRGRALLPTWMKINPLDPGPMRVELAPFQTSKVSAFDASRGIDWATQTTSQVRGRWDMPKGWTESGRATAGPSSPRLVYRQGKQWKSVSQSAVGPPRVFVGLNGDTGIWTLSADLDGLPRDADEVRLRGEFKTYIQYKGATPTGWKAPQNLRITGAFHTLTVKSKPFNVQIKGPDEPLPAPQVSHEQKIEFRSAQWDTEQDRNGQNDYFYLHLRHKTEKPWNMYRVKVFNLRLTEMDGREISLFHSNGVRIIKGMEYVSALHRSRLQPEDELTVKLFSIGIAPKGGWQKNRRPLRLKLEVSDGECWPTPVDVVLRHEKGLNEERRKQRYLS